MISNKEQGLCTKVPCAWYRNATRHWLTTMMVSRNNGKPHILNDLDFQIVVTCIYM